MGRRVRVGATLAALLQLSAARPGAAQLLTGVVREARSGQPVPGAVITILAGSRTTAQTIANRAGEFRVAVDSTGRRVLVRHIGFLPVERDLPESAHAGTATIEITLETVPAQLTAVVSKVTPCKAARDEGQALALFQQATFALLAAIVARDAAPATITVARYRREMLRTRLLDQSVMVASVSSTRGFSAPLAPEQLLAGGIVQQVSVGTAFFGLDIDLVVSDVFRQTHCFDVAPASPDHRDQIGIAFQPALDRASLPEVSGTIWLNRAPLALRALEYRYEHLHESPRQGPYGGSTSFRTIENGVVIVDDWHLSLPPSVADGVIQFSPIVQITGGTVTSAVWPDGASFSLPMARVAGSVVESGDRPVAGMAVELTGSPYRAVSKADGSFAIDGVLPGPYELAVTDSQWLSFGISRRVSAAIAASGTAAPVRLTLPPVTQRVNDRCKESHGGSGLPVLVGRVIDSTGQPAAAKIGLWVAGDARRGGLEWRTTTGGLFWQCGLPLGTVNLRASVDDSHFADSTIALVRSAVNTVTIVVPRVR